MIELNKIYNEDCITTMSRIEDSSVDLIVTSPPYNKGYWSSNRNSNNGFKTKSRRIDYGEYNDCLNPIEYEKNQINVISECLRILKPTGSLFYNHMDILNKHQTIHPKWVYNFPLKQIIIWDRRNTPKLDKSYFFPINEYIFWIQKDNKARTYFNRHNSIMNKSIWSINSDNKNKFPAPFPKSLPINCILSCSKENDIIYDPYSGSGTTCLSAKELNRQYIGSEISKEHCENSILRILQSQENIEDIDNDVEENTENIDNESKQVKLF
jgi:DNA modification methylase